MACCGDFRKKAASTNGTRWAAMMQLAALPRLLFRFGDRPGAPWLAQLELAALQLGTLVLPVTAVLSLVSLGWMLFKKVRSRAL